MKWLQMYFQIALILRKKCRRVSCKMNEMKAVLAWLRVGLSVWSTAKEAKYIQDRGKKSAACIISFGKVGDGDRMAIWEPDLCKGTFISGTEGL